MRPAGPGARHLEVSSEVLIRAIRGIPTVEPGDDLLAILCAALEREHVELRNGDVLVVASKIVSRAENCFVDLGTVEPGENARALATEVDKDPRLVELILRESDAVSRRKRGALIVRHRLGFISANAGIDASNAAPLGTADGSGPWVLTLPRDPDRTALQLRKGLAARFGTEIGVILTDSWGRPFRRGTVGFALGSSGIGPLWDRRGARDRHGRELEATETATTDALAAAADLVAGQADEGRPLTLIRGLQFEPSDETGRTLLRAAEDDLYA